MRSWLLYIPAGLIEIHPHMKYQLAITNRSWFLPWTKILTWSTDIGTHGKPEGSVPPADRGRGDIKTVEVAIAYAAWVRFSMSCMRVNDTGQNTITWLTGSLSPSLPLSLSLLRYDIMSGTLCDHVRFVWNTASGLRPVGPKETRFECLPPATTLPV